MRHLLNALAILFAVVFCVGASCDVKPVGPTPSVIGGAPSTGGASAVGGVSQGGASSGIGGSSVSSGGSPSGTTASTVAVAPVEFPACNSATHKAKPVDRSKMRLGRKATPIVEHRKVSYQAYSEAKPVFWRPTVPWALNQADLGACTGFATVQARLTVPFPLGTIPGQPTTLKEFNQLGRDVYSAATFLDPFVGHWPDEDTGSNGASALRVAVERGLFKSYSSIDSLAGMQMALQSGPVIFGIDWYEGFFYPSRCGEASKGKTAVVGGHEITGVGDDPDRKIIWLETSWDNDFGVCFGSHCGYFYLTYGAVAEAFAAGAEAEQPH